MSDDANKPDRRIVVGVDSSDDSRNALRWAIAQARLTGAAVEAVAAWQDPSMYGAYGLVPDPDPLDGLDVVTEKVLAATVAEVLGERDDAVPVLVAVVEGPAAQVLLKAAVGAELLVVGSRGHGAFAGMLLGSVSRHCVQHAPCPVVVTPAARP